MVKGLGFKGLGMLRPDNVSVSSGSKADKNEGGRETA